jgi:hypothetical protein
VPLGMMISCFKYCSLNFFSCVSPVSIELLEEREGRTRGKYIPPLHTITSEDSDINSYYVLQDGGLILVRQPGWASGKTWSRADVLATLVEEIFHGLQYYSLDPSTPCNNMNVGESETQAKNQKILWVTTTPEIMAGIRSTSLTVNLDSYGDLTRLVPCYAREHP